MNRRTMLALTTMALLSFTFAQPGRHAVAQEKHVSFSTPVENTKYTEVTKNLEIGDVPNHVVRILEVHRTYPSNAPIINGTKIVESWTRGIGDRFDGTGTNLQYVVFVMENGDKFFARMEGFVTNDSGKIAFSIAGRITGGTGRLATIQGSVREVGKLEPDKGDPAKGLNENRTDIEYSISR